MNADFLRELMNDTTYPECGIDLGKYELKNVIGSGGQGQVYCALDTELHRHVALKVLDPELVADNVGKARFETEISHLVSLNVPGVVQVYDKGTHDKWLYYTMELVDGITLDKYFKAPELSINTKLACLAKLARTIRLLHKKGISHRDIKPANVMVDNNEEVKLLDFGIAKALDPQSPQLTRAGCSPGSPAYMAPEQFEQKAELDAIVNSDLYALGTLIYEVLSGQLPYNLAYLKPREIYSVISSGRFTPLCELRTEIPDQIGNLVGRMLSADPANRPTIEVVEQTLRDCSIETPLPRPRLKYYAFTAASVVAAAIVTKSLMVGDPEVTVPSVEKGPGSVVEEENVKQDRVSPLNIDYSEFEKAVEEHASKSSSSKHVDPDQAPDNHALTQQLDQSENGGTLSSGTNQKLRDLLRQVEELKAQQSKEQLSKSRLRLAEQTDKNLTKTEELVNELNDIDEIRKGKDVLQQERALKAMVPVKNTALVSWEQTKILRGVAFEKQLGEVQSKLMTAADYFKLKDYAAAQTEYQAVVDGCKNIEQLEAKRQKLITQCDAFDTVRSKMRSNDVPEFAPSQWRQAETLYTQAVAHLKAERLSECERALPGLQIAFASASEIARVNRDVARKVNAAKDTAEQARTAARKLKAETLAKKLWDRGCDHMERAGRLKSSSEKIAVYEKAETILNDAAAYAQEMKRIWSLRKRSEAIVKSLSKNEINEYAPYIKDNYDECREEAEEYVDYESWDEAFDAYTELYRLAQKMEQRISKEKNRPPEKPFAQMFLEELNKGLQREADQMERERQQRNQQFPIYGY